MTVPYEREIFWKSVLLFTILSGAGSLFIIVSILKGLRKDFSARLVLYLSIADFCLSIICLALCGYNLYYGYLQDAQAFACRFQPVITWYFMEASILWLTTISIHSYKVVFYDFSFSLKQEIFVNFACWGFPLITSTLPLISGIGETYGQRNDLWCSFVGKEPQLLNILLYYLPCLLVIAFCYVSIIVQILGLRKFKNRIHLDEKKMRMIKKLFLFVLAYFVVWTPLTISYIYEFSTGTYISFVTEYIVDNLLHVQGMLNFILYGINENLIKELRNYLGKFKETLSRESSTENIPKMVFVE